MYSYCSLKPKIVFICIQQILHIVQRLQQEVRRLVIQRPNIQIFPGHSFLTSPFISPVFCFVLFSMGQHTREIYDGSYIYVSTDRWEAKQKDGKLSREMSGRDICGSVERYVAHKRDMWLCSDIYCSLERYVAQ